MKQIVVALVLTVMAAWGCDRKPQEETMPTASTGNQDVASKFVDAAADIHVFGYGPTERGDGSVGYFMLYVTEFEDNRPRLPWNTQISEAEMKRVILSMAANGFFEISEEEAPDRQNWRFGIYGSPGPVQRYCTKQEFDKILKGITESVPKGFKMKGR